MAEVRIALTDRDVARCFAVMKDLRPQLVEAEFVPRIRSQEQQGYRLAYVADGDRVKAVAGFRILDGLSSGRFLYVDDLVTDPEHRSKGHGQLLFDWLIGHARANRCHGLELDSGVQRFGAHRFYLRNRMVISSHHFRLEL